MSFAQWVNGLINIINTVIVPTIFALAFLVFVYGIAKYFFFSVGDEKARSDGRQFVLWGLIGMAVLFSVWGFVNLLLSTLGLTPPS